MIHLLKGVVDRIDHEWQEVIDHAKDQCSFAKGDVHIVEERHCSKGAQQHIDPHWQYEKHCHNLGCAILAVGHEIGCRITNENAHHGGYQGYAYRIDERIDRIGLKEELLEIAQGEALVIDKRIISYQEKWRNDKDGHEDDVRDSPCRPVTHEPN